MPKLFAASILGLFFAAESLAEEGPPIHEAVRDRDIERVKSLLNQGTDVDSRDDGAGWTPLMIAAADGYPDLVELLVSKGADVRAKNSEGEEALTWAVIKNRPEIARYLLDKGADPEARDDYGEALLHFAAKNGSIESAGVLLERGADINSSGYKGRTPLIYAVQELKVDMVEFLILKGANVDLLDEKKYTALHLLTQNLGFGYKKEANRQSVHKIADLLASNGLLINYTDVFGHTPLYRVVERCTRSYYRENQDIRKAIHELAVLLIGKGADPSIAEDLGQRTPLKKALSCGDTALSNLLLLGASR